MKEYQECKGHNMDEMEAFTKYLTFDKDWY
jgi:hypothetical protein